LGEKEEGGMKLEARFLVIKRADIEAALMPRDQFALMYLVNTIDAHRKTQGKPYNQYVVINQDEPYFPDVLKLMEEHEA
jgi:hypothetical protein